MRTNFAKSAGSVAAVLGLMAWPLLAILACTLFCRSAHAQSDPVASDVFGLTAGAHLSTWHSNSRFKSFTPGLYLRVDRGALDGLTLGAYRNSIGRDSAYVGWTWSRPLADVLPGGLMSPQAADVSLTAGIVRGYEISPALLALPSVRVGWLRLALVPRVPPRWIPGRADDPPAPPAASKPRGPAAPPAQAAAASTPFDPPQTAWGLHFSVEHRF